MTKLFKTLAIVLTVAMLAMIPAMAEVADGMETITLDNGVSLTYNKYDFKVDVDEQGVIYGEYLGEALEPVGFNIVNATDTDAEAYITEAAASYNTEAFTANCFADGDEWIAFEEVSTDEKTISTRDVFARNNDTGCWIVTFYSYCENAEEQSEQAQQLNDELASIADSLSFAK